MKRYHIINVKTNTGIDFLAKVSGEDVDNFVTWADSTPSILEHEERQAVAKIAPHTTKEHGTKITQARMAAHLTQRELADLLGVSIQQEQRWEYGYHKVRAETLKRIGDALGVDWSTLLEEE